MNILMYANSNDKETNERLINIVIAKAPHDHVELIRNYAGLMERVRRLPKDIDVAVLFAKDSGQLYELIELKDFFENIPMILILPDQTRETVSRATKIYPNFISSMDSDFYLVGEVLERMLQTKDNKPGMK